MSPADLMESLVEEVPNFVHDYFCYSPDFYTLMDELDKWANDHEVFLCHGATRFVLVPDCGDWVVKFDLPKAVQKGYHYCAREEEIFRKAQERGCAEHLAYTVYGGSIDGLDYYVQEKLQMGSLVESVIQESFYSFCESDFNSDDFDDEDDYRASIEEATVDLVSDSYNTVYAVLGEEGKELGAFLCCEEIGDLHSGNWGRRSDGTLVVADFGGFNG